jgi:hypothetical protein
MIKRLDPGCPVQREAGRDLSSQRCRRPQTGLFSLAAQHSPSEAYIWATNGGRKLSGIGKLALRGEARLLGAMGTKSKSRSGATVGNAIKGRRHHRSRLQHVRYPLQHSIHPQLSWRDSTGGEPMPGSQKLYPNAAGISRIPGARHPRSQPPRTPRPKRAPPHRGSENNRRIAHFIGRFVAADDNLIGGVVPLTGPLKTLASWHHSLGALLGGQQSALP